MFETEPDILHRVIARLRAPVEMDPKLDAKVMARIAAGPTKTTLATDVWDWLRRPWELSISPLGVAATALLAVVIWAGARHVRSTPTPSAGETDVQFVILAPEAARVSLVGDFNDWDSSRTPMRVSQASGIWSVTIPLAPGRHRYAYVVDGRRWMADPSSPRAQDDFGTPSSVVTVGG
jgi:negative regulator of sigma E activity